MRQDSYTGRVAPQGVLALCSAERANTGVQAIRHLTIPLHRVVEWWQSSSHKLRSLPLNTVQVCPLPLSLGLTHSSHCPLRLHNKHPKYNALRHPAHGAWYTGQASVR